MTDPQRAVELRIPGIRVEAVGIDPYPEQALGSGSHDAVILFLPPEDISGEIVKELEISCSQSSIPLLLVNLSDAPLSRRLLHRHSFDGFVDVRWEPLMQLAVLSAALRSYQIGRNVVDIQREVLSSTGVEVAQMRDFSQHDALTRLYNLRYFDEAHAREHARCTRHGGSYSIVYLDLDGLKPTNTRLGHAAGSAALEAFGRVATKLTRASSHIARVGGDEFVALVSETDSEGALCYAERLCRVFADTPIVHEGKTFHLTVSAGIATFPADGTEPEEILRKADTALYESKAERRGQPVVWGSRQSKK